jgi:hypothetical protein
VCTKTETKTKTTTKYSTALSKNIKTTSSLSWLPPVGVRIGLISASIPETASSLGVFVLVKLGMGHESNVAITDQN